MRKYRELKQNNKLSGADLNIQQMDFQTLKALIDEKYSEFQTQMNRRAVKRAGKDGAEFIEIRQFTVQEKSRPYQIWYIPTHAAAQYYGRTYKDVFVPWCISTQHSKSFYNDYLESNFYFLICLDQSLRKSKNFKIAVQVNLDGTVYLNDIKNQPGTCVIPQISEYFKQNFEWRYQQGKKYDLDRLKKYQPGACAYMKNKFMQSLKDHFNPQTGRYDFEQISINEIKFLVQDGKFIIPFGNIEGDFNCSCRDLISLEGGPEYVGGNFKCSDNQLTSLEGVSESVGGNFDCSQNQLTSLEGAPEYVRGSFNCSDNQLVSLEGAPKSVGYCFNCSNNQLVSLKGAPKSIKGQFDCCYNQLTSLEGAPESVGGDFDCSQNQLTSLEGAPESVGGDFNCSQNQLTSLEGIPKSVEGIDCFGNPVEYNILKDGIK